MLIISFVHADNGEVVLPEFNTYPSSYNSSFPIDFSWLIERYDFDKIERYIDTCYGTYYKSCEKFLASKQREIAGKFGLSDIFVKPNIKRYEYTKIILSKSIWDDKLRLRYLAPLGDMGDFKLSVAFSPYRFMTVFAEGDVRGDGSIAIAVNKPLGRGNFRKTEKRTKQLLGKAKKLLSYSPSYNSYR
jgi:hypothetical protein